MKFNLVRRAPLFRSATHLYHRAAYAYADPRNPNTGVSRAIVGSIRTLDTRGIQGLDLDFSIVHTDHNGNLARIRSTGQGTGCR